MSDPGSRYPKTVVLSDGAHLVLRLASEAGAGPGLVVVAWDGERAAGEVRLAPGDAADVLAVEVRIDAAYRGRRLGTWMLLDAVHAAEHLGAARLVADVAAGDAPFAAALARLDFFEDGARGNGVRRMAKRLHRGWTDF